MKKRGTRRGSSIHARTIKGELLKTRRRKQLPQSIWGVLNTNGLLISTPPARSTNQSNSNTLNPEGVLIEMSHTDKVTDSVRGKTRVTPTHTASGTECTAIKSPAVIKWGQRLEWSSLICSTSFLLKSKTMISRLFFESWPERVTQQVPIQKP